MSDQVSYTIPPPTLKHEKLRLPTSASISTGPDGSTTVTQSGFVDECSWCRSPWPCLSYQLAAERARADALAIENAELRAALEPFAAIRFKGEAEERASALLAAGPAQRGANEVEPMTTSGPCEACLSCAKARSLDVVYVYPSGHMLRPADIPGLSEWPARRGLTTFCGLPITGKEVSRLYDLTR